MNCLATERKGKRSEINNGWKGPGSAEKNGAHEDWSLNDPRGHLAHVLVISWAQPTGRSVSEKYLQICARLAFVVQILRSKIVCHRH